MTSVSARYSQVPANKLYINIADIRDQIVDANLNPVSWATTPPIGYIAGVLSTPGAAVLRDMGKTVYVPSPVMNLVTPQSTILRKVQLVPSAGFGTYGTGAGTGNAAAGGAQEYYTGYIRLGAQTYGGGDGFPTGVARLN